MNLIKKSQLQFFLLLPFVAAFDALYLDLPLLKPFTLFTLVCEDPEDSRVYDGSSNVTRLVSLLFPTWPK
jgi:hypothetical protein